MASGASAIGAVIGLAHQCVPAHFHHAVEVCLQGGAEAGDARRLRPPAHFSDELVTKHGHGLNLGEASGPVRSSQNHRGLDARCVTQTGRMKAMTTVAPIAVACSGTSRERSVRKCLRRGEQRDVIQRRAAVYPPRYHGSAPVPTGHLPLAEAGEPVLLAGRTPARFRSVTAPRAECGWLPRDSPGAWLR